MANVLLVRELWNLLEGPFEKSSLTSFHFSHALTYVPYYVKSATLFLAL